MKGKWDGEKKIKKIGEICNVWIHNLGLGGSLLCPVFHRTLHTFIQKLEKIQLTAVLSPITWYAAISSDKCLQDIKHTIAWHTQDPCFLQKHSDSVGHEKAGDSRVGNGEASCLSREKKCRSTFVPWNQGFSGKSGETQCLVFIVLWSLLRMVKRKGQALKRCVPEVINKPTSALCMILKLPCV